MNVDQELERLLAEATINRDARIDAANREYQDVVAHVKWFRNKLGLEPISTPATSQEIAGGTFVLMSEKSKDARGILVNAVKAAAVALRVFTIQDVIDHLDANRPDLGAGQREQSIASTLSRLKQNGFLINKVIGARGRSHVYGLSPEHELMMADPEEPEGGNVVRESDTEAVG